MKITIIGTGYVGLVSGACFSDIGHKVCCLDIDKSKINNLKKGILPIYEKKLDSVVRNNYKNKRLTFTSSYKKALSHSQIVFIAVDTPAKKDGTADLTQIKNVSISLAKYIKNNALIIEKSTVPVGTCDFIRKTIIKHLPSNSNKINFSIASNPEFLKEGSAVDDFTKPDRIIVGINDNKYAEIFSELYAPFNRRSDKIQFMDVYSSELTKYAANAMLATKISFINELANISDKLGVDIDNIRKGIGADKRIGYDFLYPGCGYGGSCLPKDLNALIKTSKSKKHNPVLLDAVNRVNDNQKLVLFNKAKSFFKGKLRNRNFAVWGIAFKPNTNDIRFAPSIDVIKKLIESGVNIKAYDPVASLKNVIKNKKYKEVSSSIQAIKGCDALIIFTEWKEFWSIDIKIFKKYMNQTNIFDGRNIYSSKRMKDNNINYFGIGKKSI